MLSKDKVFIMGFILLIFLNIGALYKIWDLQREKGAWPFVVDLQQKLTSGNLQSLTGEEINLAIPDSLLTLVVFFSPSDCVGCLEEAKIWESLHEKFKESALKVIGVASSYRRNSVERFVQKEGLTFPIIFDYRGKQTLKLGVLFTPFKVVLNQWGGVLFTDVSHRRSDNQKKFGEIIEYLVKNRERYFLAGRFEPFLK